MGSYEFFMIPTRYKEDFVIRYKNGAFKSATETMFWEKVPKNIVTLKAPLKKK